MRQVALHFARAKRACIWCHASPPPVSMALRDVPPPLRICIAGFANGGEKSFSGLGRYLWCFPLWLRYIGPWGFPEPERKGKGLRSRMSLLKGMRQKNGEGKGAVTSAGSRKPPAVPQIITTFCQKLAIAASIFCRFLTALSIVGMPNLQSILVQIRIF